MSDKIIDRREPGFYIVDNEVIEVFGARIGVYGIAVYNVLLKFANASGENAFPSYQKIADLLGISRPKAIEGVKILLEHGLIEKTPRMSSSGDPTTNIYTLLDVKKIAGGSKQDLLGSKQNLLGGGKQDLLGGKQRLPDQYPLINTQSIEQDPSIKNQASPSPSALPPARKARGGQGKAPHPNTQPIMLAYEEALGYDAPNYAKESASAKKLAQRNYTPEDVAIAYHALKKQPYWENRFVSLGKVLEEIQELGNYAKKGGDINSVGRSRNKADRNAQAFDEFEQILREQGLWNS